MLWEHIYLWQMVNTSGQLMFLRMMPEWWSMAVMFTVSSKANNEDVSAIPIFLSRYAI